MAEQSHGGSYDDPLRQIVESAQSKLMRQQQQQQQQLGLAARRGQQTTDILGSTQQQDLQHLMPTSQSNRKSKLMLKSQAFARNILDELQLNRLASEDLSDGAFERRQPYEETLTSVTNRDKEEGGGGEEEEVPDDQHRKSGASLQICSLPNVVSMPATNMINRHECLHQSKPKDNRDQDEQIAAEHIHQLQVGSRQFTSNHTDDSVPVFEQNDHDDYQQSRDEDPTEGPTPTNDLIRALIQRDRNALNSLTSSANNHPRGRCSLAPEVDNSPTKKKPSSARNSSSSGSSVGSAAASHLHHEQTTQSSADKSSKTTSVVSHHNGICACGHCNRRRLGRRRSSRKVSLGFQGEEMDENHDDDYEAATATNDDDDDDDKSVGRHNSQMGASEQHQDPRANTIASQKTPIELLSAASTSTPSRRLSHGAATGHHNHL